MYNLNYIFYLVGLFICVTNVTDAANVTQIDEEVDIESLYKALRQDAAKYRNKTPPKSPFCFPLCPQTNGIRTPIPNKISRPNGCGSYSIHIDFKLFKAAEFNTCCNFHDDCYDNCAKTKNLCDLNFDGCLANVCAKMSQRNRWGLIKRTICYQVAKLMYSAVEFLGCLAYDKAQKNMCKC